MTAKKKKLDEMTEKEIQEELVKSFDELESLAPELVGSMIKLSKSFYAVSKDEKARASAMKNKDLRKKILKLASATDDLRKTLFQFEEVVQQKLEELKKKRDSKKKD